MFQLAVSLQGLRLETFPARLSLLAVTKVCLSGLLQAEYVHRHCYGLALPHRTLHKSPGNCSFVKALRILYWKVSLQRIELQFLESLG